MTTRSTRLGRALLVVLLVAVSLASPIAEAAEPSAADLESARSLYVEGLQLRDKGDLDGSLQRFRAAHALAATAITTFELGRAQALLGQLVEARETLLQIERIPATASESPKAAHARVDARALSEHLRTRIPTLVITFAPPPPRPPRVTVDGAQIPDGAVSSPRKVNPGKHVVAADIGAAHATSDVVVAEGETQSVLLRFEEPIAAAPVPAAPPPPPPPPVGDAGPPVSTAGTSAWLYVGAAAAGVGVVVGTITGIVALSKASALEKECTGSRCPGSAKSDLDTSRTMGTVSTVAFAVAGVGAVVAVLAWLATPDAPVRTTSTALHWTW